MPHSIDARTFVFSTRSVQVASVLYVTVPSLLFFLGWLHWWVSVPVTLLLAIAVREAAARGPDDRVEVRPGTVLGVSMVLFLWAVLSGVGGFGHQNSDYLKHNAILDTLVHSPWPVVGPGGTDTLVYFLSYYLPGALVGKVFGTSGAMVAQFFFSVLGLHLAAFWFWRFSKQAVPVALGVFLFASGLDAVGALIYQGSFHLSQHLEWWGTHAQYSSQGAAYFWVPQHALYSWIAVGLVLSEGRSFDLGRFTLLVGCGVLWSPFAALGMLSLLPFIVLGRSRIARAGLVAGAVFGGLLSLYILSSAYPGVLELNRWPFWKYVVFVILEYLVFLPFIDRKEPVVFVPVVLLLTVLPVVRLGLYNDLAMRASLPALFVLWLHVARDITELTPWRRRVAAAVLIIGAITSFQEAIRGVTAFRSSTVTVPRLIDVGQSQQYFGRGDAWYFRMLVATDEGRGIVGSGEPEMPATP